MKNEPMKTLREAAQAVIKIYFDTEPCFRSSLGGLSYVSPTSTEWIAKLGHAVAELQQALASDRGQCVIDAAVATAKHRDRCTGTDKMDNELEIARLILLLNKLGEAVSVYLDEREDDNRASAPFVLESLRKKRIQHEAQRRLAAEACGGEPERASECETCGDTGHITEVVVKYDSDGKPYPDHEQPIAPCPDCGSEDSGESEAAFSIASIELPEDIKESKDILNNYLGEIYEKELKLRTVIQQKEARIRELEDEIGGARHERDYLGERLNDFIDNLRDAETREARLWACLPKIAMVARIQIALDNDPNVTVESDNLGWCLECVEKNNLDALERALGIKEVDDGS